MDLPSEDAVPIVRPYARTRGRTRSDYDLPIEALVTTTDGATEGTAYVNPEHRPIAELCVQVQSVAEVAAKLTLPLGVARVLLGDMARIGLVFVHTTAGDETGKPEVALLEKVLSGLRQL
ncbi:MAG: DUF742 domain-containing protein [Geodermatophilaceae bacterium]|nr:DUF742 domain-containing protein [Geodermatophilaceae bacterium]